MLTMTRFALPKALCTAAVVAMLALALSAAATGEALAEDNQTPPGTSGTVQQAPQQSAPPAPSPAAVPAISPQPAAASKPGLLDQMKAWWDGSIGFFDAKIKDTRGTVDTLNKKSNDAAKGVAASTQDAVKGAFDVSKDAAAVTQGAMKGALDVSKDAAAATQGAVKGALDASKDAAGAIVRLPNTRMVEVHERCATAPNGAPDCGAAATTACRSKGFATGTPLDVRTAEKCDTTQALQQGQRLGKAECPIELVITRAMCQ